jgi:hypothetical protein
MEDPGREQIGSHTSILAASGPPPSARVRIPDAVVYRAFAHETVILNLETGLYHGVNPTGGQVLDALVESGSIEGAVAALAARYQASPAEVRGDVHAFCRALIERGLLVVESG